MRGQIRLDHPDALAVLALANMAAVAGVVWAAGRWVPATTVCRFVARQWVASPRRAAVISGAVFAFLGHGVHTIAVELREQQEGSHR